MSLDDANTLSPDARSSIERIIGTTIAYARKAPGGYSATQRWIMTTSSGTSVFAKIGMTVPSRENILEEIAVYKRLYLSCMPRVLGWDTESPLLVLEDLSSCVWPPPWNDSLIDDVLRTINDLHSAQVPLEEYGERHGTPTGWWQQVAANSAPFLRLEIVSGAWLQRALPALIEYESLCSPAGSSVCHFDLRSDNLCLSPRGVVVIDWSHACLGNPELDVGLFLPGLAYEDRLVPETILANAPGIAAWVSGFYAVHASKPFIPTAPLVRSMQRHYLETSLAWAIRALHL
jgi:hypothetical protein